MNCECSFISAWDNCPPGMDRLYYLVPYLILTWSRHSLEVTYGWRRDVGTVGHWDFMGVHVWRRLRRDTPQPAGTTSELWCHLFARIWNPAFWISIPSTCSGVCVCVSVRVHACVLMCVEYVVCVVGIQESSELGKQPGSEWSWLTGLASCFCIVNEIRIIFTLLNGKTINSHDNVKSHNHILNNF